MFKYKEKGVSSFCWMSSKSKHNTELPLNGKAGYRTTNKEAKHGIYSIIYCILYIPPKGPLAVNPINVKIIRDINK